MRLAEDLLPAVTTALNATSGVFVFFGVRMIKAGRKETHQRLMIAACASSTLFLVGYFAGIALNGTHRFPGDSWIRTAYLLLLVSHTLLAAATLPLVLRTLFLSYRERFDDHRAIARWTVPIWMYVSVTGVVVYLMLYQVAPRLHDASAAGAAVTHASNP
jgi:uncharacterized membrane protein YozB (DUF420 family)